MSQHAQLESLVAIATKHFNEQIMSVATRLVGAMLDVSEVIDPRQGYLRVKSGNLLKENQYAFVHLATTEFELTLRRELEQLVPSLKKVRAEVTELSLVPFEEMDNKVAFDAIARPFEFKYATQIATLNVRLGVLLDREILRIPQNPFRPDVFLSVLNRAWCEFEPEPDAHALIQAMLRPAVLFDFAPLYDALCDALVKKGAQPGSVEALNIRKTESAAAAKQARSKQKADLARQLRQFLDDEKDENAFDGGIPLIPDLPNLSASSGGWRPSAAQGFNVAAPAEPGDNAAHSSASSGRGGQGHAQVPSSTGFAPAGGHHGQGGGAPSGGFPPVSGHGGHGAVATGGLAAQGAHGQMNQTGGFANGAPGYGGHGDVMAGNGSSAPLLDLLKQLQSRVPELLAMPANGNRQNTESGTGGYHGGGQGNGGAQSQGTGGGQGSAHGHGGANLYGGQHPGGMHQGGQHQGGGQHPGGGSADGFAPGANIFYLPRLKESMPKGSLSRGDESTIDLLSRIFDTVFIDPNIPTEIRELMQFLQIPVLRAALADKNFFFEEAHPARRMIDLMSRIGMEQRKAPDDPLFQAMRRSIDRVGREADESGQVFSEALAELEQSVKADDEVAQSAIAAPIAAALKQEKVTAATRSAKSAVAARIGSGEVVAMLETFLENRWTSVLTVAYSVEDDKPGAVGNATKTMDDLIWSVKPKITREERKTLINKLPGLLATLNRWLDVIKWQDADRLQFFAELAECHASIVRAPLDISPERQLEIAVEVAQQDALRRLEKEQLASEAAPAVDIDDAALAIEALERNQWLEFTQLDGSVRKVKLAWISPLRTLFIFSTGARQEAFSVPVEKLQAAFREHKVRVMRVDGLVGRALSEAMKEKAGNDPSVLSSAAA